MTKIKKRIRVIPSLPPEEKEKVNIVNVLIVFIIIIGLALAGFIAYKKLLPYLNAVDVKKIAGKKVFLNECNIKDYVIISTDKSYTLSLTDNECNTKNYSGDVLIKDNKIYFNDSLYGLIDNNFNIIINNNIFKAENVTTKETN